jgi:hypothetical protein
MLNRFTRAATLSLLILVVAAPVAQAAAPKTAAAVRKAMSSHTRYVFAGSLRACAVLDNHGRAEFVASWRRTFKKHVRNCRDAMAAWAGSLRKLLPLAGAQGDLTGAHHCARQPGDIG